MKTTEIIKGNLPDTVTLTDEDMKKLVKAVNDAVGEEFLPKAQYAKKTEAVDAAEREIAELKAKLTDVELYKGKYEAEVKAHADTKAATVAEKTTEAKQAAVVKALLADGVNEKLVKLVARSIDLAKVELDGEAVKNWENVSQNVKAENADLFQVADVEGVKPATPPIFNGGAGQPSLSDTFTNLNANRIIK